MKPFPFALIFLATPALAQTKVTYTGPELAAPTRGMSVVIVHTPDSAKVAYLATVRGLLAAGYGLDKQESAVGYVGSTARLLPTGSGVRLLIQATVVPTPAGSDIIYRGLFTWASVLAMDTPLQNQQMPAVYMNSGPSRRAWDGLQQVAVSSFPAGRLGYK